MRKFTAFLAASVSLAAMAPMAPAMAQDSAADEEEASEDIIIVQARRKDESLQDVPLSVQAVSGADLQKLEIRNFQDISAAVPGLQLTRAPNGIQNTVTMRGISFNPTAAGPQTAVELYRNDVVTSSGLMFQALYDVGQIEVLRGPQGTLRGRASPSGSITITTKKPDLEEVGGFGTASFAEGGKQNYEGALNVPVIAGRLGVRVAAYLGHDDLNVHGNNRFNGSVDKGNFDKIKSLRASVRAVPIEDILTLDFNYETTKRNTRLQQQVESRRYVDGTTITGPVDISSRDYLGIQVLPTTNTVDLTFYNWQAQLKLVGQQLTYVGGRNRSVTNATAPEDFGGFLANPFAPPTDAASSLPGTINPFAQLTKSFNQAKFHEVRLQNEDRIAGIFDYVVGYMNLQTNTPTLLYTTNTRCVGGAVGCTTTGLVSQVFGGVNRIRSDEENSFYGNLTAHLGDRTEISGGIRRIKFARIAGLQSAGRLGAPTFAIAIDREPLESLRTRAPVASFAVDDVKKKTIYMFSGKHEFSDDFMVYASYGTAVRPGNGIVCSRCNAAQGATLNAGQFLQQPDETSKSAEIGFKSSLLDNRLTFNVSLFQQKFKNFAIVSPAQIQFLGSYTPAVGVTPATGTLSAGPNSLAQPNDVKITGIETEFVFKPSDRFSIGGNMTYTKSKVNNGRVPCIDLNNDGFQDADSVSAATLPLLVAQAGAGLVDICPVNRASPAPKFSGTFQSEYNMPVGDSAEGYLRGLLSYNGSTVGDDVNPVDSVKAYSVLNAYLGVRDPDGAWDLSVFARNLLNTHRVLTRDGTRATTTVSNGTLTSDYYNISTTAPREFGVTLRLAFGSR